MLLKPAWKRWFRIGVTFLRNAILILVALFLLGGSVIPPSGLASQVGVVTRDITFDFATWTVDAVLAKFAQWGLSLTRFLSPQSQSDIVLTYLGQVERVQTLNADLTLVYADPEIVDHNRASQALRAELAREQEKLNQVRPLAESILQSQLMAVIDQAGLAVLGQGFPPSLYQASEVPTSLVVSERTEIKQIFDVSLVPGLTVEVMEQIETTIFEELDRSALVVPIGGIGTYPTMVMQTTSLVWLTEVIAHEWVHNFLTLRPLGMNYMTSPELRTINETTASLAGKELGRMILEQFYPDQVPPEPEVAAPETVPMPAEPDPDAFDFRREMRITREEVDRLLAIGEVEAVESYMEARRVFFWENGYRIRRLNQAYFAFYGAYNDAPGGGAAGEDPVGPAVQAFRAQFDGLADFLYAIARVKSLDELMRMLD